MTDWSEKRKRDHPGAAGFSSHWDFKREDGTPYFTIEPDRVDDKWLDITSPNNVFEVPEVWYGVERAQDSYVDCYPWHEIDFVKTLWEKYSEKPVGRVLEVCCGSSPHGSLLAREGIEVYGVDSSKGMVDAVNTRGKVQKLPLKAYKRDIFQFSIPGEPPDAALLLGATFPLSRNNKTDNTALVSQLRSVGMFLLRNTLYFIDCGVPEPHAFVSEYNVEKPRTVDIGFAKVTLTSRVFPTDVETLATPFVVGYHVTYPGGRVRLENKSAFNFVSAQHLAALVELSNVFELEAFHHWGQTEPGLVRGGGSYLAVLRRV